MCCWRESYEVFWAILLRPVMTFKNGFLDVMRSMDHSLMFRIIQKIKDSYFASSHLLWQSLDQWNYKVLLLMGWSTVFCADCTFQGQRFTSLGGMGHCRWSELKLCPGFLSLPDLLSRACMINKSPNEERAPWKCLEDIKTLCIHLYFCIKRSHLTVCDQKCADGMHVLISILKATRKATFPTPLWLEFYIHL